MQDTYLKAFRAADRFEPGTNLRAWLFTILHNTARNRFRDRARDTVADRQRRRRAGRRRAAAGLVRASARNARERCCCATRSTPELQAAIDALPEAFRQAVWLRTWKSFLRRNRGDAGRSGRHRDVAHLARPAHAVRSAAVHARPRRAGRGHGRGELIMPDCRRSTRSSRLTSTASSPPPTAAPSTSTCGAVRRATRSPAERPCATSCARAEAGLSAERASDALRAGARALARRRDVAPRLPARPVSARAVAQWLAAGAAARAARAGRQPRAHRRRRVSVSGDRAPRACWRPSSRPITSSASRSNGVLGTHDAPAAVESVDAVRLRLAPAPARAADAPGSTGRRAPCLYGEGKVAHMMYRHNGRPVSLFMLPEDARAETRRGARPRGRDLVGRRPHVRAGRARVRAPKCERMATFVERALR